MDSKMAQIFYNRLFLEMEIKSNSDAALVNIPLNAFFILPEKLITLKLRKKIAR